MSASDLFANIPLGPPPKGVKSDFNSPAKDATTLWAINLVSLSFVVITVMIRLYVKRFVSKQKYSWDDGFCLAAMCAAVVHTGVIIKELEYGLGKHMWNIRALSFTQSRLLAMTSANLIIAVSMLLVRISVLALYHRLFSIYETSKKLIYIGYVLSIINAIPEIGVVIGRMVKCTTITAALTDSYCSKRNISIAVTTFASVACLLDVFIYSIAISRLRSLHVNSHKKGQLTVIFAMGLVAVLCSLGNVIFNATQFGTNDQLWYAMWVSVFKTLETNIALTCACATFLPAFWKSKKPAFSWVGSAFRTQSQGSSVQSKNSSSKDSPWKGRGSDEGLVMPHHLDLPDLVHTKSERSDEWS